MEVTRYTHSCVRVESDGHVLVIDPGVWSEPQALRGADAVLLTHEHFDHVDELRVAGLGVPVYAPAEARLQRLTPVPVEPGESFTVAGFTVGAVGGQHARVLAHQVPCANVGFTINGALHHPGDSLDAPDAAVDTLLVPLQASWLSTAEIVRFVTDVAPTRAIGIHDGQINERGLDAINHWLAQECAPRYSWLPPGTTFTVPGVATP